MEPAVEAKLRIFSNGLSVSQQAVEHITQGSRRPLALIDYVTTSGITLELEGQVFINAPLSSDSTLRLELDGRGLFVNGGGWAARARVLPLPSYHSRSNADGVPYSYLVATHTDRVRVSPIAGCAYRCHFCDLPYTLKYQTKQLPHLVDAVRTALADPVLPANHVLISGGTPLERDRGYLIQSIRQLTAAVDVPVDVMMVPWETEGFFDELNGLGIRSVFLNMELAEDSAAREVMPQKARQTREQFLHLIEEGVTRFGKGRVLSLILVGLEDVDTTLGGVERLCEVGCTPVLSPFRPSEATPLRRHPLPSFELLREVHDRAARIARSHALRLGPPCGPCQHNTLTLPADFNLSNGPAHGPAAD